MEFIFELLFEIFGELILQLVLELLFELGWRSVGAPFTKSANPLLAGVGYALFGALAGGLSLWLFPRLFIGSHLGRIANVVVTPLLAASAMAALGGWRRRRDRPTVLLDRFAYAFIFAMAMALVRLKFGGVRGRGALARWVATTAVGRTCMRAPVERSRRQMSRQA